MPLLAVVCPHHKISGGSGIRAVDIWTIVPTHRQISGGSGIQIWRTFVSLKPPKQSAESKQTADNIRISHLSYLTTLYCMLEVKSVEILNFLNFGDDEDEDEKQLVGLRQAEWPQAKIKGRKKE